MAMKLSGRTSEDALNRILGFIFGLLLLLVTPAVLSQPSQSLLISDDIIKETQKLTVNQQLDVINHINTQRSEDARTLINTLERQHTQQPLANIDSLRLTLLRCFNLLEFGYFDEAITLAKQGEIDARELKYDAARPYFMQCEAEANQSLGNVFQDQRLTEESQRLAKRYSEKQAIVNNLYASSRQNTSLENYNASIEDLRLALDLFDDAQMQFQQWYLIPKSYLPAEISNVFFSMNDLEEALHFSELAYKDPSTFGKLNFAFAINLARINMTRKDKTQVLHYLTEAEKENNKNISERDIATGNALLASIRLYIGNLDIAEQLALSSIELFTKYQDPIYVMRIKRTLAKVYFAQNKDAQALTLLDDIMEQASTLKQFSDLEEFSQITSEYYAGKNQFNLAYQLQLKRFDAAKQARAKLNNAHFTQYKAQMSQQNQPSVQPKRPTSHINQNLAVSALIILLLSIGLAIFLARKQFYINNDSQDETQQQRINNMLTNAKRGHYQLSLLLINISHIRQVDIPFLQQQIQPILRQQDQLFRHNLDDIIVILPYASTINATRVMNQIELELKKFEPEAKNNIGIASLQQLDTFDGLMKRAILNQLTKMKPLMTQEVRNK